MNNLNIPLYRAEVRDNKFHKKWDSYININSKKIHIGHFADKLDAAKAYDGYVLNNNLEHTKNF